MPNNNQKIISLGTLSHFKDNLSDTAIDDAEIKQEIFNQTLINDYVYTGTNLAEKFADEIADYSNVWAWIKARITAGNFSGINVCDYIEVTTSYVQSGSTQPFSFKAQIAGINTYKGYNGTVKNHIDFISENLFPVVHEYNIMNTNNGNAGSNIAEPDLTKNYPWLASLLYLWLNSLSGDVPSTTGEEWEEVDYSQDGVYFYLPSELKSAITPKTILLPIRYSASGQLADDNNFGMVSVGNLWLPDEVEVYGMSVQGGKTHATLGNAVQYPIFIGNMRRRKTTNDGVAHHWWLSTASARNTTHWCYVAGKGAASHGRAIDSNHVPICFRIMA